jgi:hypothetical protein
MKVVEWLTYSIEPGKLTTILRPGMWGNGQLEVMAALERPMINDVMCYGFEEPLQYGPAQGRYAGDEHLVPAVYDAESGRKYLLYTTKPSGALKTTVTFRPDRQTWRHEFDDLSIEVALILPRMQPGYFFKVTLQPAEGNLSQRWFVYHEVRAHHGNTMAGTEPDCDVRGGRAWWKSYKLEHPEAVGASSDAVDINIGMDGPVTSGIMIQHAIERDGEDDPTPLYFARTFGDTLDAARSGLETLLASPEKFEAETVEWWERYIDEVPRLDAPDEELCKVFLWSWPNFRMNRIDVPIGAAPAGLCKTNNLSFKMGPAVGSDHNLEETVELLHDPQAPRDMILYWLKATPKKGLLRPGVRANGLPAVGNYVSDVNWMCGLLHKYLLSTNDLAFLDEDIGGVSVLERLEDAMESQVAFHDEATGLIPNTPEHDRFGDEQGERPVSLGTAHEAVMRYRGGAGYFYSDTSATAYGGYVAMAEIQQLIGKQESAARFRKWGGNLGKAIQKHFWNEDLAFYTDLNPDRTLNDYIGIGGFITGLFANPSHRPGGLATAEQAAAIADWCNHEDFVSEFGVLTLARSSPFFDPVPYKGRNSSFNFSPTNQIPAGLYAHGCYEEGHRQMSKQFRRLGENAGLGPRYRAEAYDAEGHIIPWRFQNYPCNLAALNTVIEGVFGLRWTKDALTADVHSPWPWAKLSNMRIRDAVLDLELQDDGTFTATINGKEAARSDDGRLELPWGMFSIG